MDLGWGKTISAWGRYVTIPITVIQSASSKGGTVGGYAVPSVMEKIQTPHHPQALKRTVDNSA